MTERPYAPVVARLLNGQQRNLLLSMGAVKRIKARLGVKTLEELLQRDAADCVPILYEALSKEDRATMTEDQFADLLPADLMATMRIVASLFGASFPDTAPRPTGEDGQSQPNPTGPPSGGTA